MRSRDFKYLLLILVIFTAACIETDIYLPAFPDMMTYFSASEAEIQSILTWNFIGICISGPLYGPISDAVGRKGPLLLTLGLFLLGSLITLFATQFNLMLWGRALQGLGSGGCFTLGTAIIFDAFRKEKAIHTVSQLNTIIPLIMAGAPLLGGYLNQVFGFRSNFLAITLLVLASFAICLFFFDETLPKEKRSPLSPKQIAKDFRQALLSLPFWQVTLVVSLAFAGYLSFLSTTAVLFVVDFGMSPSIFPLVQAAVLAGWVIASLLCSRAIKLWGIIRIKIVGTSLILLSGLGFIAAAIFAPESAFILTFFMVIYAFGANWTSGLYWAEVMEILPHIKGVTASLVTSGRLLITALVVALCSALYNETAYPLIAVILGVIVLTLPLIFLYEKKQHSLGRNSHSSSSDSVAMH